MVEMNGFHKLVSGELERAYKYKLMQILFYYPDILTWEVWKEPLGYTGNRTAIINQLIIH